MKKPEKKTKTHGFFQLGFFLKKPIGSNQIGPNQAHPERCSMQTVILR